MNQTTADALNAINLAFYRERAAEFSATREHPWPGWERLAPHARAARRPRTPLRVLDLGCGNGRFAAFLAARLAGDGVRIEYCGVDASEPLLARARARRPPHARTRCVVLDFAAAPARLPAGPFDLVVLLGVLHGVPSRARRRALLREAAGRLAPSGRLALTSWRFAEQERFRRRLLAWDAYNQRAAQPIDVAQLEPGDHLLPWGQGAGGLRYCHASGSAERAALVRGLGLERIDGYLADGRSGDLNRYAVYHRRRRRGRR